MGQWFTRDAESKSVHQQIFVACDMVHSRGPLYWHAYPVIPKWDVHYKIWDVITYPFPNFSYCTIEIWEWINNCIPHFDRHMIYCFFKFIHVNKKGPRNLGIIFLQSHYEGPYRGDIVYLTWVHIWTESFAIIIVMLYTTSCPTGLWHINSKK